MFILYSKDLIDKELIIERDTVRWKDITLFITYEINRAH